MSSGYVTDKAKELISQEILRKIVTEIGVSQDSLKDYFDDLVTDAILNLEKLAWIEVSETGYISLADITKPRVKDE